MGNTLKVGSIGRYGSRYGVGIRKRLIKIESKQNEKHECPSCTSDRVKRTAAGIYECRKCGHIFAGGTFVPVTLSGSIVSKMVSQKKFSSAEMAELEKALAVEQPEEEAEEEKPKKGKASKHEEEGEGKEHKHGGEKGEEGQEAREHKKHTEHKEAKKEKELKEGKHNAKEENAEKARKHKKEEEE